MTESQARRIELLLRAQLAVSAETLVIMNLGVILGGKGLDLKQAEVFTDKAMQTKKTINMVLESVRNDVAQETVESVAQMQAAVRALEAESKKPPVGFKP
jgi:hypothetical protein